MAYSPQQSTDPRFSTYYASIDAINNHFVNMTTHPGFAIAAQLESFWPQLSGTSPLNPADEKNLQGIKGILEFYKTLLPEDTEFVRLCDQAIGALGISEQKTEAYQELPFEQLEKYEQHLEAEIKKLEERLAPTAEQLKEFPVTSHLAAYLKPYADMRDTLETLKQSVSKEITCRKQGQESTINLASEVKKTNSDLLRIAALTSTHRNHVLELIRVVCSFFNVDFGIKTTRAKTAASCLAMNITRAVGCGFKREEVAASADGA